MQWYNRMFSDFFKRRDFTAMGKVLKDAESFADRLIEQCTPGLSHLDENTAIAAYYCYRGLHAEQMLTTERTLREFEKSLAWDPQDTVYITNLAVTLTNHADEIVNAARKAQATSPASKTLTSALASAISHLNEALEHSPSYDTALTKLAKFQAEYERITNP
jgi:tetratricopeptide (TPR) repeat protein